MWAMGYTKFRNNRYLTQCFINDDDMPQLVFEQRGETREILNSELFEPRGRMMTKLSPDADITLQVLRKAIADTLDRKRRLGHYAVIWREGKAIAIGEDAPIDLQASQNSERIE